MVLDRKGRERQHRNLDSATLHIWYWDDKDIMSPRRLGFAAQRAEDRRLREDEAPRLSNQVRGLLSLSLTIEDRSETSVAQPKHVRHVVVGRAPALVLIR